MSSSPTPGVCIQYGPEFYVIFTGDISSSLLKFVLSMIAYTVFCIRVVPPPLKSVLSTALYPTSQNCISQNPHEPLLASVVTLPGAATLWDAVLLCTCSTNAVATNLPDIAFQGHC